MRNWIAPAVSPPASLLDLQRGTKARHLLDRLYEHQLTVPSCLELLQAVSPAARSLNWSPSGAIGAALGRLYAEEITVDQCAELLHEAAQPTS